MSLFGRRKVSRFPAEMGQWLDEFGRKQLGVVDSGLGTTDIEMLMADLYFDAQADPAGFATDLRAVVAADTGGFAVLGASRLLLDMFGHYDGWPAGSVAILDAAIENKRRRGPGMDMLTGYERERYFKRYPDHPRWPQAPV